MVETSRISSRVLKEARRIPIEQQYLWLLSKFFKYLNKLKGLPFIKNYGTNSSAFLEI